MQDTKSNYAIVELDNESSRLLVFCFSNGIYFEDSCEPNMNSLNSMLQRLSPPHSKFDLRVFYDGNRLGMTLKHDLEAMGYNCSVMLTNLKPTLKAPRSNQDFTFTFHFFKRFSLYLSSALGGGTIM